MAGASQGVITTVLPDINALYLSYMPYLKNGGVFVPSDKKYRIGDEVFLLLSLLDDPQRHGITGRVVWVNARPSGMRPVGIGVQFVGPEGAVMQQKIEAHLADILESDRPTHTL